MYIHTHAYIHESTDGWHVPAYSETRNRCYVWGLAGASAVPTLTPSRRPAMGASVRRQDRQPGKSCRHDLLTVHTYMYSGGGAPSRSAQHSKLATSVLCRCRSARLGDAGQQAGMSGCSIESARGSQKEYIRNYIHPYIVCRRIIRACNASTETRHLAARFNSSHPCMHPYIHTSNPSSMHPIHHPHYVSTAPNSRAALRPTLPRNVPPQVLS